MNSKKYLEFELELKEMVNYLQDEATISRLNISAQQHASLNANQQVFSAIMASYTNPDKRTSSVTQQTLQTYKTTHKWTADFRQAIKANNKDELTEQDYHNLTIHQDKPRTKHTQPKTIPTLKLDHIEPLNARISAHQYATHDKGNKPSRPQGVDTVEWQWVITDTQATPQTLIYTNHKTTQSATLNLEFNDTQIGQFCHAKARYAIHNGESGAYSITLTFAIT